MTLFGTYQFRSYFMFHKMDAHQPQSIFRYLPILSFTESFIYQVIVPISKITYLLNTFCLNYIRIRWRMFNSLFVPQAHASIFWFPRKIWTLLHSPMILSWPILVRGIAPFLLVSRWKVKKSVHVNNYVLFFLWIYCLWLRTIKLQLNLHNLSAINAKELAK